jgi:peptidoglycan/LPS O-acetylase OafA/YrhL
MAVLWFIGAFMGDRSHPPFYSILLYLAALIITTLISSISFYLLEKPISDLKDKFFSLKTT